jgi:hypothetical protein
MKPILLPAALFTLLVAGCAPATIMDPGKTPAAEADKNATTARSPHFEDDGLSAPAAKAAAAATTAARAPGDFIVYKFSGSYRKAPATLTERVIAREGDVVTIDMTLEDASGKRSLRVKMSDAPGTRGDVASVARLENGQEIATGLVAYDTFLAATMLAADSNEETLASEDVTVDVGGAALAGKRTTYRVRVGKEAAMMSTVESTTFAWGDLGGEIKAKNGKVLYRAEILEVGHAAPAPAAAVANSDIDE